MRGHLRLHCALDVRGLSSLQEQSFSAPIHLSKPHLDEGVLVVNVVNPTAGLLEGDRIDVCASVGAGAGLLLTSPSASRAHKVREGFAAVAQHFRVEAGGFLEVFPEMFIPQAGSRFRQETEVAVESGGVFLQSEMIAPGRVASGEAFLFDWLEWRTDVRVSGRLVARERLRLVPGERPLRALRASFEHAYYASVLAMGPAYQKNQLNASDWELLQSEQVWLGGSPVAGDVGWSFRIVAQNAPALRDAVGKLRSLLYLKTGRSVPHLRRVTGLVG